MFIDYLANSDCNRHLSLCLSFTPQYFGSAYFTPKPQTLNYVAQEASHVGCAEPGPAENHRLHPCLAQYSAKKCRGMEQEKGNYGRVLGMLVCRFRVSGGIWVQISIGCRGPALLVFGLGFILVLVLSADTTNKCRSQVPRSLKGERRFRV